MEKVNRVLLIDDNQTTTFLHQRLIQKLDIAHQIVVARNGQHALELMEQQYLAGEGYPELILLDLKMPVMDGFAFYEAYKRLESEKQVEIKVVVLTTSLAASDIESAKKAGMQHFANKPLTAQKLNEVWPKHKRNLTTNE